MAANNKTAPHGRVFLLNRCAIALNLQFKSARPNHPRTQYFNRVRSTDKIDIFD